MTEKDKIEQEMVEELKPLTPEQRINMAAQDLAAIQMKYGVVLAVVTVNKTPSFAITELKIVPREQVQQG